jgi:hypothetical protein
MRWKAIFVLSLFVTSTAESHGSPASRSEAIAAVSSEIQEAKASCAPEQINAEAVDVDIAPKVTAELVTLTSGGGCFGQPGANSYLVAKDIDGSWKVMASADPGFIAIDKTSKLAVASITVSNVGLCELRYTWTGSRYRATRHHCSGLAPTPQSLDSLATLIASARNSAQTGLSPGRDGEASDGPQVAIRRAIAQEKKCGWTSGDTCGEKIFSLQATQLLHSYCTSSFATAWLGAIKHNDEGPVWDGDIFTKSQNISLVGPKFLKTVRQSDDLADIDVAIETADVGEGGGTRRIQITRFRMRLEDGSWKIDDLVFLHQEQPSPRGGRTSYRDESMKALLGVRG